MGFDQCWKWFGGLSLGGEGGGVIGLNGTLLIVSLWAKIGASQM